MKRLFVLLLVMLSGLARAEFDKWPREQCMAFLINASIGCPALRNEAFTATRGEDLFAKYAMQSGDLAGEQAHLCAKAMPVRQLDYDWSLNVVGR